MYKKLDDLRKLMNAKKVSFRLADIFCSSQVSGAHNPLKGVGSQGDSQLNFIGVNTDSRLLKKRLTTPVNLKKDSKVISF